MNLKNFSNRLLTLALASHLPVANAVCFYPGTEKSGYKIPLKTEVRTAESIVVGRVLSEQQLREEANDPDSVTASNVTIKVLKKLKGTLSGVVVIRNENTSSRYPMSVGEKHILFVSRTNREAWIDSCRNSEAMPNGRQVVKKVQTQLRH